MTLRVCVNPVSGCRLTGVQRANEIGVDCRSQCGGSTVWRKRGGTSNRLRRRRRVRAAAGLTISMRPDAASQHNFLNIPTNCRRNESRWYVLQLAFARDFA